jgi:hypothetical protein
MVGRNYLGQAGKQPEQKKHRQTSYLQKKQPIGVPKEQLHAFFLKKDRQTSYLQKPFSSLQDLCKSLKSLESIP